LNINEKAPPRDKTQRGASSYVCFNNSKYTYIVNAAFKSLFN